MIYWRQASSVAETHGLLGVDVTIVKTIHGVAVVLSCLWVVGLNADALRRIEVQSVVAGFTFSPFFPLRVVMMITPSAAHFSGTSSHGLVS